MVVSTRDQDLRLSGLASADESAPLAGAPIRQSGLWRDAARRYVRNRVAVIAAAVFLVVVAYCLIVPMRAPDDPEAGDGTRGAGIADTVARSAGPGRQPRSAGGGAVRTTAARSRSQVRAR